MREVVVTITNEEMRDAHVRLNTIAVRMDKYRPWYVEDGLAHQLDALNLAFSVLCGLHPEVRALLVREIRKEVEATA